MPLPSTLGERMGVARRRKGITLTSLAKAVGLSPQTLGLLERGGHRSIQASYVRKIARELEVTADYLLGMDIPEDEIVDRSRHDRDATPGSRIIPIV